MKELGIFKRRVINATPDCDSYALSKQMLDLKATEIVNNNRYCVSKPLEVLVDVDKS